MDIYDALPIPERALETTEESVIAAVALLFKNKYTASELNPYKTEDSITQLIGTIYHAIYSQIREERESWSYIKDAFIDARSAYRASSLPSDKARSLIGALRER